MSKPVDSAASRAAARQAQQAGKAQPKGRQASMGIGAQPAPSTFGQVLQDSMQSRTFQQNIDTQTNKQEQKDEGRLESRDSQHSKTKESAEKSGLLQDRVRESKGRDESRDQSDSKEDKGSSHKKDSGDHAKQAEQRVVGKQGRGDSQSGKGQHGKGQEGQHGAGQQSQGQTASSGKTQSTAKPEAKPQWNQAAAAMNGPSSTAASAKASRAARAIPQRVIDMIVSYARLHSKKDGETEMELALRDEVFKGLRMRISTKNGKITTTFITSSRDVRDLFKSERHALRRTLSENGLDVEGIDVIMT